MSDVSKRIHGLFADRGFASVDEEKLQHEIARLIAANNIPFAREVDLGDGDRIDFLVDGTVGLEVKVKGGRSEVIRQLHRYAQHDRIERLMLATTRWQHANMPGSISGKPLSVIALFRGCL